MTTRTFNPDVISRIRKERHLLKLSEDDFRDQVVRPLLVRQGLRDGRDLCGPEEEGKDALFVETNALGLDDIWAVQTKRGALSMAGDAGKNIVQAVVQLRTALATRYAFVETKEKKLPSKAILCASGKINAGARRHIVEEVNDPRLLFLDSDALIPLVDKHYPEFWLGIDADAAPYFRNLRASLEETNESADIADILAASGHGGSAVVDDNWVPLHLYRPVSKPFRIKGRVEKKFDLVQIPITSVTSLQENQILVIGDAGAGKSTALRRIAYKLAEKAINTGVADQIPVVLRARDLADTDEDLLAVIAARTAAVASAPNPVFGPVELAAGKLVLMVDALDEVSSDDGRRRVLERIGQLRAAYPKTRTIITSREYSFIGDMKELSDYLALRMTAIDLRQAKQIVERVARGKKVPVEGRQELLRRLQEVHGFQLNPLLVTVFAATADYTRRDIPANITELFKKFTELMLGRWDATKGFGQQYQAPVKDFLLQRIALRMHEKRLTSIPMAEFRALVAEELTSRGLRADAEQLIDEIVNRSGLLRTVGATLEFRHHLVQEFFAGRAIQGSALSSLAADEWWQRPLVFFFGDNADKYPLLAAICAELPRERESPSFVGAVTVGLALQACYLISVPQKLEVLRWVIDRLSFVGTGLETAGPHSLMGLLAYYLTGRDAVSAAVLSDAPVQDIRASLLAVEGSAEEKELRQYWLIVGLAETGKIDVADKLIREFNPSDKRLLLTLHLGCLLLSDYRYGSAAEKRGAREVCEYLDPKIAHFRQELLRELETELLEIQQGKVKALPATSGARKVEDES